MVQDHELLIIEVEGGIFYDSIRMGLLREEGDDTSRE